MLKQILETVGTRYLAAIINLLMIFINGKILGLDGVGQTGIIFASVNIGGLFGSVLCENTIVYFMNRYDVRRVYWAAVGWAFIGTALACAFLYAFGMMPDGYGMAVGTLSLLLLLVTANTRILLGKERIGQFNLVHLLQSVLLFGGLLLLYFVVGKRDVEAWLWALFAAHGTAAIISFGMVRRYVCRPSGGYVPPSTIGFLREMFAFGLWSSLDNLAEGFTMRLNYFLLQRLGGYGQVGLLDSATKVAESVWHISRSTGFIAYGRIAATTDTTARTHIALRLFKLTAAAVIAATLLVIAVPEWVYTDWLFTAEFVGIRTIVCCLAPGVVAFGCHNILSHYFTGSGRVKYSTAASFVGLAALAVADAALIPSFGIAGAAAASSVAYISILLFSLIAFTRLARTSIRSFLPSQADLRTAFDLLRRRRS